MEVITAKNFNQARDLIRKSNGFVVFSSDDDELNRQVLEKEKIEVLLLSQKSRRDFQKQRNSGFNQVLAKIAKKNNVKIGINFDELVDAGGKEKAKIISRIRQNIKLCNKNKLKMVFVSRGKFRSDHDLKALGLSLGMPSWMLWKKDKNKHF